MPSHSIRLNHLSQGTPVAGAPWLHMDRRCQELLNRRHGNRPSTLRAIKAGAGHRLRLFHRDILVFLMHLANFLRTPTPLIQRVSTLFLAVITGTTRLIPKLNPLFQVQMGWRPCKLLNHPSLPLDLIMVAPKLDPRIWRIPGIRKVCLRHMVAGTEWCGKLLIVLCPATIHPST
jgi:hypothetical protein